MKPKNSILIMASIIILSCNSEGQKSDTLILEKMRYTAENFDMAVNSLRYENKNLLKRIHQEVKNKGNRSYDVEIAESGKKVVLLTDNLFTALGDIKSQLNIMVEHDLASIDQQNEFMLTDGNGDKIKDLINNYVKELNAFTSNNFEPVISESGTPYSEIELFFKDSPAIATFATLVSFENQLCNYERTALNKYAMMTGTR
ncbi:hypothetical protein FNH22_11085 [Fulvivirga sp. M361]|uniref:hypothetical protein n=1 Tax=Fulvivirga sp. M361 TaxID=2594266 RepID=UPI001179C250|nr:hypothetical protein [Fulvivirga sp. M361]TRX59064.1 hypothetical protein FNH22_11085 [Fulvivirga sp. M361]